MLSRFLLRTMVTIYKHPVVKPLQMTYMDYVDAVNANFHLHRNRPKIKPSIRTGMIGYKQGMTTIYNKWGVATPCTVVQVIIKKI